MGKRRGSNRIINNTKDIKYTLNQDKLLDKPTLKLKIKYKSVNVIIVT